MLLRIEKLLSPEQVQRIRAILSSANWSDGALTAGPLAAPYKKNLQLPENDANAQAAMKIIMEAVSRNAQFLNASFPKKIYPPMFNRYEGAKNTYGSHVDNALRTHGATGNQMRTDISCTVFLSEPEEYDGGELVIEDTYGTPSIKFAAGDMVLYPSSSVHRVEPVTRGARFASFFWIESIVRSAEQRRLLYELNTSVEALKTLTGASPEAVRLSGVYNNLLRMWGDA